MKRSSVLKIYDVVHVNLVRVCMVTGALFGGLVFARVCSILWTPQKRYNIEEDPDYLTIVRQQQENKEMLKD